MKVLFVVLAATVTVASGLVRSYTVEPKSASLSGWTGTAPGNNYVSQVLTCSWDELDSASTGYCEVFAGEYGQGGAYNLSIRECPGGTPVAHQDGGTYVRPQHWVRFDRIQLEIGKSFTKGKKYEFRFTRSGSDSAV